MKRRSFFHFSSAALALGSLSNCSSGSSAAAVKVAVIGVKGRGAQLIKDGIRKTSAAVITAICDVDSRELDDQAALLAKDGITVTKFSDYRKLLESKDVDAVVIATPNHTHTLIAMSALAAGKHVYVEKPVCHNLWEGKMLVEASAKKPSLILQHGMQRRSNTGWIEIMKYLSEGSLGKLKLARGINWKRRETIGKLAEARKVPKTVDANLWFGPRAITPVMREKFHYDWHWFWDFGNGDIGNQGPHQFDVALWGMGDAKLPTSVQCLGNRWGYDDNAQTPNQQVALFKGEGGTLLFDNRGLPAKTGESGEYKYKNLFSVGNTFECENGWIGEKFAYDGNGKELKKFTFGDDTKDHMAAFFASIQAGKPVSEHLKIEKGYQAAAMAHLANISYRVGQATGVDAVKEQIKGDATALATFDDLVANLTANGVDLAAKPPVLGAALTFDHTAFKFTGAFAEQANALLTEEYREEFKLPTL